MNPVTKSNSVQANPSSNAKAKKNAIPEDMKNKAKNANNTNNANNNFIYHAKTRFGTKKEGSLKINNTNNINNINNINNTININNPTSVPNSRFEHRRTNSFQQESKTNYKSFKKSIASSKKVIRKDDLADNNANINSTKKNKNVNNFKSNKEDGKTNSKLNNNNTNDNKKKTSKKKSSKKSSQKNSNNNENNNYLFNNKIEPLNIFIGGEFSLNDTLKIISEIQQRFEDSVKENKKPIEEIKNLINTDTTLNIDNYVQLSESEKLLIEKDITKSSDLRIENYTNVFKSIQNSLNDIQNCLEDLVSQENELLGGEEEEFIEDDSSCSSSNGSLSDFEESEDIIDYDDDIEKYESNRKNSKTYREKNIMKSYDNATNFATDETDFAENIMLENVAIAPPKNSPFNYQNVKDISRMRSKKFSVFSHDKCNTNDPKINKDKSNNIIMESIQEIQPQEENNNVNNYRSEDIKINSVVNRHYDISKKNENLFGKSKPLIIDNYKDFHNKNENNNLFDKKIEKMNKQNNNLNNNNNKNELNETTSSNNSNNNDADKSKENCVIF